MNNKKDWNPHSKQCRFGQFYTPTPFVDYAHKMNSEILGDEWKENYIVWDCCCGSNNLTRDYRFNRLYCSTLEQAELEIGKDYNPQAIKFQFDFLNDPLSKAPQTLLNDLESNKPFVFFINPPYATSCVLSTTKDNRHGTNDTKVRLQMRAEGLGAGAENIQHQFIYRICKIVESYKLTNVYICLYSNPIYLSGTKAKVFLQWYCNRFEFVNGVLFQASHFSNVSTMWGITYNVWKLGKTQDVHNFKHSLIEFNDENELTIIGEKDIYNAWGGTTASEWAKEPIKGLKTSKNVLHLSSGVKVGETSKARGSIFANSLGWLVNGSNNVSNSAMKVALFSAPFSNGNDIGISKDNFLRCTALFTARKSIQGNWINYKDEYLKPNTDNVNWVRFEGDSVIYSLFHSSSNQSSLRQVQYRDDVYNVKNEFFYMSALELMDLATEKNNYKCYNDANCSSERFVYLWLRDNYDRLSKTAKAVLNKAMELTRASFQYRKLFDYEHPEYQINNWDCGWYQIKAMLKSYMPNELKEFNALYKQLQAELIPLVYEIGFLKNLPEFNGIVIHRKKIYKLNDETFLKNRENSLNNEK